MRILIYIGMSLVAILGLTFAGLNATPVTLNYYVGQVSWPLSLLLILAFIFGGLLGALLTSSAYLRLKIENSRLSQRIKALKSESNTLSTLPAIRVKQD